MPMIKKLLGIIAGLAAAVLLISLVQMLSNSFFPKPEAVDLANREAMAAWIAGLPLAAKLTVLASYIIGSAGGGLVATLVSRAYPFPAVSVSGVLTVFAIMNMVSIPHPIWLAVLIIICFLPAALFGAAFVRHWAQD